MAGCLFQNVGYKYVRDVAVSHHINLRERTIRAALGGVESGLVDELSPEVAHLVLAAIAKATSAI